MSLTLASLLGVYKIKTPALVECTFCLHSKEIEGGMTINRIDKYKLCICSVRNSKEVRVARADLLKGIVVGEALERWAGVRIVVNTDGKESRVPLKDVDFGYERWRAIVEI